MTPERFELHTPRLLLRRWRESDLAPFAAMNADPAVMEHLPKLLTRAESDDLAHRADREFDDGLGRWATGTRGWTAWSRSRWPRTSGPSA